MLVPRAELRAQDVQARRRVGRLRRDRGGARDDQGVAGAAVERLHGTVVAAQPGGGVLSVSLGAGLLLLLVVVVAGGEGGAEG